MPLLESFVWNVEYLWVMDKELCRELGLNNGYGRKLIHKSRIFTFTVYMYLEDFSSKNQTQYFSGVRAHNQNDYADHSIQTIMYIYCSYIIHVSLRWTDSGVVDFSL